MVRIHSVGLKRLMVRNPSPVGVMARRLTATCIREALWRAAIECAQEYTVTTA